MAFGGILLRRLFLLDFIVVFLIGGPGFTQATNKDSPYSCFLDIQVGSQALVDLQECEADAYKGCVRLTFKDRATGQVTHGGHSCRGLSGKELRCLGKQPGVTQEGNCFHFSGTPTDFQALAIKCHTKRGKARTTTAQVELLPRQSGTDAGEITYCGCNDKHGCNYPECECSANYGPCGAEPCDDYQCVCQGEGGCTNGSITCEGDPDVDGCLSTSPAFAKFSKNCMDEVTLFNCVKRKMRIGSGPVGHTCVTGTFADYYKAAEACPRKHAYVSGGDPRVRVKMCHCAGKKCNVEKVQESELNEDYDYKNGKAVDMNGGSLGQRILALGSTVMIIGAWICF